MVENKNAYKNYSIITKCEFLADDEFSNRLVEHYKRMVYSAIDEESKKKAKIFDFLMRKYIEDYNFSKKFQKSLDVKKFLSREFTEYGSLIDYMLKFSERYDNDKQEVITSTKWI